MSTEKMGTCEEAHGDRPHKFNPDVCVNWREQPAQGEPRRQAMKQKQLQQEAEQPRVQALFAQCCSMAAKEIFEVLNLPPTNEDRLDWRSAAVIIAKWCHSTEGHSMDGGVPAQPEGGEKPPLISEKEKAKKFVESLPCEPASPPAAEGVTARDWLRKRSETDTRVSELFDTLGKLLYVRELLEDYAAPLKAEIAKLRQERDTLQEENEGAWEALNMADYEGEDGLSYHIGNEIAWRKRLEAELKSEHEARTRAEEQLNALECWACNKKIVPDERELIVCHECAEKDHKGRERAEDALRELLKYAVILDDEYLETFKDWPMSATIQGWDKQRWLNASKAKKRALAALNSPAADTKEKP